MMPRAWRPSIPALHLHNYMLLHISRACDVRWICGMASWAEPGPITNYRGHWEHGAITTANHKPPFVSCDTQQWCNLQWHHHRLQPISIAAWLDWYFHRPNFIRQPWEFQPHSSVSFNLSSNNFQWNIVYVSLLFIYSKKEKKRVKYLKIGIFYTISKWNICLIQIRFPNTGKSHKIEHRSFKTWICMNLSIKA